MILDKLLQNQMHQAARLAGEHSMWAAGMAEEEKEWDTQKSGKTGNLRKLFLKCK